MKVRKWLLFSSGFELPRALNTVAGYDARFQLDPRWLTGAALLGLRVVLHLVSREPDKGAFYEAFGT